MPKRTARPKSSTTPAVPPTADERAESLSVPPRNGETRAVSMASEPPERSTSLSSALPSSSRPQGDRSRDTELSEEDIRARAYQRYVERGGGHGQDVDDWIKAEQELRNRT